MISTTVQGHRHRLHRRCSARRHDRSDCVPPRVTTASASRALAAMARPRSSRSSTTTVASRSSSRPTRTATACAGTSSSAATAARLHGRAHDGRPERLVQRRAQDRRRRAELDDPRPRHARRRGLQRDGEAPGARVGSERRPKGGSAEPGAAGSRTWADGFRRSSISEAGPRNAPRFGKDHHDV